MRAYSFKNTVMLVSGVAITGFSEGDDVIKISRRSDSATDKVGADGKMMMSLSSDRSGEITFKLQQTSSSNRFLSQQAALQDGGTDTFQAVAVKFQDTYRNDVADGSVGYIKKHAELTRGAAAGDQEWTIVVEDLDMLLGDQSDVTA